jgi:outer membrane receptor for monomeric catechols
MSRYRPRHNDRAINQENRPTKHSKKRKKPDYQPPHKFVVPTVALTMALTSANALAQDKDVLTAPPIEVREQRPGYIVPNLGLSRLPEPTRDIPQTINIVPQELMQEQGVSNLQDALRNVTGISFQAGEGGGAQGNNLSIRGFTLATISSSTACATRDRIFGMSSISRPSRS